MGNGVRQGLNYSEFSKLMIFAPSRKEQDDIVVYLKDKCSAIEETIALKKEQLETLEEYKESVIYEYVSDYKLNLIAPCEISDFSKFKTSLGPVLQLLRVANDEDAMGNLITTNLAFRELENEAVETINVFAGLNIQPDEEKEVTDMCKAWDDHYRSGVQQGEHAKRIEAIENMISLGLTKEKILTKYSEEEYEEAEKAMLVET